MVEVINNYPNIMKYWDAEKNLKWDSNSISIKSRSKVFWICPDCSHRWQSLISTTYRLSKIYDKFCPCCNLGQELVPEKNSILAAFPSIINYIDFHVEDVETIKEKLMSYTFTSKQVFQFKCPTCHEVWRGCAQDLRFKLTDTNELLHKGCRKSPKSYYIWTYPNLSKIYRNDLNTQLFKTMQLNQNVTLPYYWKCDKCHFEFEISIDRLFSKIRRNGTYCPKCQSSFEQPIDLNFDHGPVHFNLSEQLNQLYIDFNSWSPENSIYMIQVDLLSNIEIKWVCSTCDGVYSCPVYEKDKKDCPYCHHKQILKGFNTLEKTHSYLKEFWNPKNSSNLDEFWYKSYELVSWICPCCSVSFECSPQEIVLRTDLDNSNFQTCPNFCDWVTGFFKNNTFYNEPILNEEWSSKNSIPIHLAQTDIVTKKYWWSCSTCGGDYRASIPIRREVSTACPYCNNEEVLKGYNSLLDVYPKLAKMWSPQNTVSSDSIIPTELERRRYIWQYDTCELDFTERFSTVLEKYLGDSSLSIKTICPYCSKRLPDPRTESLDVVKPFLVEEWLSDKHGEISEVFPDSKKIVEWECRRCHAHYEAAIHSRCENDKCCPYCTGKKLLKSFNSIADVYPELVDTWSSANGLVVTDVIASSKSKWLWVCKVCHGNNRWTIEDNLDRKKECPYCSNKQVLSGFNSLDVTHPQLVQFWGSKNSCKPEEVMATSAIYINWQCLDCHGDYNIPIRERVNQGFKCPYCSGKQLLSGYNSFDVLYPELMKEWDYLNNILLAHPKEVKSSNQQNVWWICKNNHEHRYKMSIKKRILFENRSKEPCLFCKGRRRKREHFVPYK